MLFQEQNNCLKVVRVGGETRGDEAKEKVSKAKPLKHMKENTKNEELEAGWGNRRWKNWWGWEEIITFILWISVVEGIETWLFYMRREGEMGQGKLLQWPSMLQSSMLVGEPPAGRIWGGYLQKNLSDPKFCLSCCKKPSQPLMSLSLSKLLFHSIFLFLCAATSSQ